MISISKTERRPVAISIFMLHIREFYGFFRKRPSSSSFSLVASLLFAWWHCCCNLYVFIVYELCAIHHGREFSVLGCAELLFCVSTDLWKVCVNRRHLQHNHKHYQFLYLLKAKKHTQNTSKWKSSAAAVVVVMMLVFVCLCVMKRKRV